MGVYSDVPQVYVRHEETGGEALISGEPGVVEMFEAKGWRRFVMPDHLDPDAPDASLPGQQDLDNDEPEPILTEDEALALKGQALDDALERAELPKTGTADEKRARLAEHEAGLATTTTEGDEVDG